MFPTLVSGVGLLSVHFVFSGFPRTFNDKWWHAVPRFCFINRSLGNLETEISNTMYDEAYKKELAYERIQKVWEAMVSCIEDWPKTRFEHPMMKSILMKKIVLIYLATLCCVCVNAVDIKRYVKEGGTGNGLTWEAPTGDLASVLGLASQVDNLTVYVGEGSYVGDFVIPSNVSVTGKYDGKDGYINGNLHTLFIGDITLNSFLGYAEVEGSVKMCNATMVQVTVSDSRQEYGVWVENANGLDKSLLKGCIITNNNIGLQLTYGVAELERCVVYQNKKWGVYGKRGHLEARFCQFSENASTGIQMYSTDVSCRLYRCYISENKGGGFHGAETRDAMYTDSRQRFISCSFFNNHSQSTGSAIWARSRVYVDNSLFLFNQSEAADGAAIYCMFDGNQFVNCTIMNNKGGVCLSKNFGDRPGGEPDPLLVNCALWNNGEDFVNPFNRTYKLQTCAMQTGGSGIPELDAERGLILLEAENEGTTPGGMYIALDSTLVPKPGSCLINRGTPLNDTEALDYNGRHIGALGGTDIGACEYQGEYKWVPNILGMKFFNIDYRLASTTYNGTAYYSLIPKGCEDPDTKRIETTFATIYLGTKRNAYAAIPDTPFMAVYREGKPGEKALCNILAKDENEGIFRWNYVEYISGKTRPVVKKHPSLKNYFLITIDGRTQNLKMYN